jgi:hypothetical protein
LAPKSSTHLGSPKTAENNRAKADSARELLEELINYAITSQRRGSVSVRINFNPGYLTSVKQGVELDTANGK